MNRPKWQTLPSEKMTQIATKMKLTSWLSPVTSAKSSKIGNLMEWTTAKHSVADIYAKMITACLRHWWLHTFWSLLWPCASVSCKKVTLESQFAVFSYTSSGQTWLSLQTFNQVDRWCPAKSCYLSYHLCCTMESVHGICSSQAGPGLWNTVYLKKSA